MTRASLLTAGAALTGFCLGLASTRFGVHVAAPASPFAPVRRASPHSILPAPSAEEAFGKALQALLGKPDLLDLAEFGASLESLDSAQIAQLLDRLESHDLGTFDTRLAWLFDWWLSCDPKAAEAWLHPRLLAAAQDGIPGVNFRNSASGHLILGWAESDPLAAAEFARLHSHAGLASELLRTALENWPEKDPTARLAMLLRFPAGRTRQGALEALVADWSRKDPGQAISVALALTDPRERQKTVAASLQVWAEKDPLAAWNRFQSLPLPPDPKLQTTLLIALAQVSPDRALEFLDQLDDDQFSLDAPAVVAKWAESDPAAALGWALGQGLSLGPAPFESESIQHDSLERASVLHSNDSNPLWTALRARPQETFDWVESLPDGADRIRLLELVTSSSLLNLDQSLQIFESLPADSAARSAQTLGGRLFSDNPDRAQTWAASFPPGPLRAAAWAGVGSVAGSQLSLPPGPDEDALISGAVFSYGTIRTSAVPSLNLAFQISDPQLRQDTLEQFVETYGYIWAAETRTWIENAAIPDAWKQSMLSRLTPPQTNL